MLNDRAETAFVKARAIAVNKYKQTAKQAGVDFVESALKDENAKIKILREAEAAPDGPKRFLLRDGAHLRYQDARAQARVSYSQAMFAANENLAAGLTAALAKYNKINAKGG